MTDKDELERYETSEAQDIVQLIRKLSPPIPESAPPSFQRDVMRRIKMRMVAQGRFTRSQWYQVPLSVTAVLILGVLLAVIVVLILGVLLAPPFLHQDLFEDDFERDELGEMYENLNPDPNRLAVMDGKLLIVGAPTLDKRRSIWNMDKGPLTQQWPVKNVILLNQTFPGNFVANVRVNMQVTAGNSLRFVYWLDAKNKLVLGVYGFQATSANKSLGRHIIFTKYLDKNTNNIAAFRDPERLHPLSVGGRELGGYPAKPEAWYFQIERKGVKYTARVSVDGAEWHDVATHTVLNKGGRLGFSVAAGWGAENAAEFDDFVVKDVK